MRVKSVEPLVSQAGCSATVGIYSAHHVQYGVIRIGVLLLRWLVKAATFNQSLAAFSSSVHARVFRWPR
jgi:hypothetical protein